MKSKSIFLMAVSLGFGLIAAIGIRQVLGRSDAITQPSVEMAPVIVAAKDIDASTELTKEMVTIEMMPLQSVPEGAASTLEQIEGRVIRTRVGRRFAINLADVVDKSEVNTLAIPPGFKVVGIKVSAEEHINGLLQPGDLVDIMGVFRQGPNNSALAITFLKKVRVFSVDGALRAEVGRDANTKNTTIVSVLATQKQAEKLVLVQRMADLKIALLGRDSVDEPFDYEALLASETDDNETTLDQILSNQMQPAALHQFLQQPQSMISASSDAFGDMPQVHHTMRVITASGIQTVRFGQFGELLSTTDLDSSKKTNIDDVFSGSGYSEDYESSDIDLFDGKSNTEQEN